MSAESVREARGFRSLQVLVAGLTLVIILAIAVGVEIHRRYLHTTHLQQARHLLIHDAGHAAERVEELLQRVDALHGLANVATVAMMTPGSDQSYAIALHEVRANLAPERSGIVRVSAVGLDGTTVWSSDDAISPDPDHKNREYFRAIVDHGAGMFVGQPVRGHRSSLLSLQFAKPIHRPDGGLVAVAVVSIEPAALSLIARTGESLRPVSAAIYRADGVILAASAEPEPASIALATLHAAAAASVPISMAAPDGRPQLLGVRSDRKWGLMVALTRDVDDIVREVDAQGVSYLRWSVMAQIAALALGGLALLLVRLEQRAQIAGAQRLAIERSLTRLDEMEDNLHDLVVISDVGADRVLHYTYASPAAMALLGYTPAELIADNTLLQPHPDDVARRRQRFDVAMDGGCNTSEEFRIRHRDGRYLWMEVTSRRIADDPARPGLARLLICYHDVTQRRASEQLLDENRQLLEAFMRDYPGWAQEMVVREGADGRLDVEYRFFSTGLARITGYLPGDIRGIEMGGLFAGHGAAARQEALLRQAIEGKRATTEGSAMRADGREIYLRTQLTVVERAPADDHVMMMLCTEISEERVVRAQLEQAGKLAFLGEMAASIAHELNLPLGAAGLHVETLAMDLPPSLRQNPTIARRLETIGRLIERATATIRHIRDFSRDGAGELVPFVLTAAVQASLTIMEGRLRQTGTRVVTTLPEATSLALGRAASFEQVLMNLIGNAIDAYVGNAVDRQRRLIEISAVEREGRVLLTVSDKAGGIPAPLMARIFEPFVTTKSQGQGTGLGLSISQRIVTSMGGRISARNCDGGAAFVVELPSARAA